MQLLSLVPFKTQKSLPTVGDNRGTSLLIQAGMIRMTMAGAYNYTTLGLRVLRNIEKIVRSEMDGIGSNEILMTALGSAESWIKTGRWDSVDVLFKLPASEGKEYALNPTHEEVVTPLLAEFIQSYKDLDTCSVYQIQSKFRNEKRAKSGLLRGREFLMKDMYSFHRTQEDLDTYFEMVHAAYDRVFARLGLGPYTHYTFASGGDFSKYSYEFQTELGIGEDEIYICQKCGQAHNKEIIDTEKFVCAMCAHTQCDVRVVSEVANIFKLGNRFSEAFGLGYQDADGQKKQMVMGCYGIGISRLMGVLAEKLSDEKGLCWADEVAPYTHHIIVIGDHIQQAKKLATYIESLGGSVLLDDRNIGYGAKAADSDLWGIPTRIVVSDKTVSAGGYETKARTESTGELVVHMFE